jgi:LmbE family N-acetylglucosaminyl deacetylase
VPQLHAEIVAAVEQYRPDAVITFAEDGLYWHLDHIGVHERTCTAVASLGESRPALYYVTIPQGVMREVADKAIAEGWTPPGTNFWGIPPEAFDRYWWEEPTLTVDVRDWVSRKLAALRCHRTQVGSTNPLARLGLADARLWLGVERFRRAPFSSSDTTMLDCIGDPVLGS